MNLDLDQHFLNAKNVLLLEKNLSNISKEDNILEIGAGDGRLSEFILQGKPEILTSIEKDFNFEIDLLEIKKKYKNKFNFIIGDGLNEMNKIKFNKLISNIPYTITEPLYHKILEKKIPFVLLLHGIKFYNKILDETSKWHYLINSYYKLELIKEIPGNAFKPPTKTMSVLIRLILKEELTEFDKLLQIIFSKKTRSVKNNLIFSLVDTKNITKKEAKEIITKFNLNEETLNKKFENLSNKEFVEIIQKIKEII